MTDIRTNVIHTFAAGTANDKYRSAAEYSRSLHLQTIDIVKVYGWSYMHSKRISKLVCFKIWIKGRPPPRWAAKPYALEC